MSCFSTIGRFFGRLTGRGSAARRLLRETRSATAVEFAMIGTVLFLFFFSLFMLGIGQFWQLVLDDSVRNAARQVSMGASGQPVGVHDSLDFINNVCSEFGVAAPNCLTTLQYSVQSSPTFAGISPATVSASGILSGSGTFASLSPDYPILVQVAYILPINIPLIPARLFTLNGTSAIVSAAATVGQP